jgi:hypothetical protein
MLFSSFIFYSILPISLANPTRSLSPRFVGGFEASCYGGFVQTGEGGGAVITLSAVCKDKGGKEWHSVLNLNRCLANVGGNITRQDK